jgi:hypothetical protein
LVKSLPLRATQEEVDYAMIRAYGRRVRTEERYFAPMKPQFIHGGVYKGMTLVSTTTRTRKRRWWLDNGRREGERTEEEVEEERVEEEMAEDRRLAAARQRIQPYVHESNKRTRLHGGKKC